MWGKGGGVERRKEMTSKVPNNDQMCECGGREEEGREGEGVRKGGRGEKENDLLNLCTFSLAEVSHDDHQLLLEESL